MKLYVSNILFKITEDDLRQAFSQFGEVVSVDIVKDRETGKSKGFGFIVMGSADEGKAAIAGLNDTDFNGRTIRVSEAQARPPKPGGRKSAGGSGDRKGGDKGGQGSNRWGQGESGGGRGGQGGGRGGQSAFGGPRGGKGGGRGGQGGSGGGRGGQGRGR